MLLRQSRSEKSKRGPRENKGMLDSISSESSDAV